MYHAAILIRLPDHVTLAGRDDVVELLRGSASVIPGADPRDLFVHFEASTQWDLALVCSDAIRDVDAMGMYLDIPHLSEYEVAERNAQSTDLSKWGVWNDRGMPLDIDGKALFRRLAHLKRKGYQPRYNGRPSCPFCGNFVDAEETHLASCILMALPE